MEYSLLDLILALLNVFFGLAVYVLFVFLMNSKFERKYKSKIVLVASTIAFTIVCLLLYNVVSRFNNMLTFICYSVALFLYAVIFLKGSKSQMLLWVLFSLTTWLVAQLVSNIQLLLTFGVSQIANGLTMLQMMPTLFVFFLVQTALTIFVARRKTNIVTFSPLMMVFFIAVPSLSLWLVGKFSQLNYDILNNVQIYTYISLVIINIGVYALYEHMSAITVRSLNQQAELQKASLELVHNDEIKSLYDETRRWRHDYRNHLQAMQGFINTQNYEELAAYMEGIGASLDKIDFRVNSGSDLLNAIISAKMSRAEAHHIRFDADVSYSKEAKLEPVDVTTLVANLLDNAIEACARITDPEMERRIDLKIANFKGSLGIVVKNSTDGEIRQEKGRFITSKNSPNHGIGMQQIDDIVNKYNAMIARDISDNQFTTVINLSVA